MQVSDVTTKSARVVHADDRLGDAATKADAEQTGIALSGVAEPGGRHTS